MMPTHAHDSRGDKDEAHEVIHDASCTAATSVPMTVSSMHNMREALRG